MSKTNDAVKEEKNAMKLSIFSLALTFTLQIPGFPASPPAPAAAASSSSGAVGREAESCFLCNQHALFQRKG